MQQLTEEPNSIKHPFGYVFSNKPYNHSPGFSQLNIYFNGKSTDRHFNPVEVVLPINSKDKFTNKLIVQHPWEYKNQYDLGIGQIVLIDHKGKKIEAFSLGGKLKIFTNNETLCLIESSAPILPLNQDNPNVMLLYEEIEILLAEKRAESLPDSERVDRYLCTLDPIQIYMASLKDLKKKYENFPHKEDPQIGQFLTFIHHEVDSLKNEMNLSFPEISLLEIPFEDHKKIYKY